MELGYSSALEVLWLQEDLVVWYVTYPYTTLYNNSWHFFLSKVTNVLFDIGHWLHHYRFHAPGHCASPWRTRCLVSCQWSILHLRCAFRRPISVRITFCLFCNPANVGMKWLCCWLGLRARVAYSSSFRAHGSGYHHSILES